MKCSIHLLIAIAFTQICTADLFYDENKIAISVFYEDDIANYVYGGRLIELELLPQLIDRVREKKSSEGIIDSSAIIVFHDEIRANDIELLKRALSELENPLNVTAILKGETTWDLALYEKEKAFHDLGSFIELIERADSIRFRQGHRGEWKEYRITEKEIILEYAEILRSGVYPEHNYCLCTGWLRAYFYEGEEELCSIAPIHGDQLRIYWEGNGGDYKVTPDFMEKFLALWNISANLSR